MKSVRRLGWLLVLVVAMGSSPLVAEQLEGQILRVAGRTLLVDTTTGQEVVTLERGGSLTGARSLLEVPLGVPVQVTWAREVSGVKLAEVIAIAPEVMADPELWIDISELLQSLQTKDPERALTVVDSRSHERFLSGHLPGALSVPAVDTTETEITLPREKASLLVFYSEGPRCGLAQAGARKALRQGYSNVRVLRNGLKSWVSYGGHLLAEVPYAADQIEQETRAFLAVDVRAEGSEGPTLPGATRVPLEDIARGEFLGATWMPSFLFVGEDEGDPRPAQAAEKVRTWRASDSELSQLPVYVLEGGIQAWVEADQPTMLSTDAPRWVAFPVDEARGELSMEQFLDLWPVRDGGRALMLDVRGPGTPTPDGVTHIPLEQLHERVAELPREQEIVAYCNFGNRSAIAYLVLSRLGYDIRFLPFTPNFLN